MKKTIAIPKARLFPPIDFTSVMSSHTANGVNLRYEEYEFILTEGGRAVLFDAYTASHKYAALNIECGVLAYPFSMLCMTDEGERVAYCGLRFGDESPEFWQLCHEKDGSALMMLAVDADAVAVPVPSGVCVLSSVDAYNKFAEHIRDDVHPLSGSIILNGQTHTVVSLYGSKYAVFSAGWGDGNCKCYAGKAANGKVACIIVDCGMIEYPPKYVGQTERVQVDVSERDFYINDPKKSESENNIIKWTDVIQSDVDADTLLSAYSRRGYAYHSMNRTAEALADYEAAVSICVRASQDAQSRAWAVFDNAAELYCKKSDYNAAILLMERALALGDDFYSGAYVRLIDLYLITKQFRRAFETAVKMLSSRPDDPVANMKYAEACVAVGDYEGAAETYETLASSFKLYDNLFDEASCLIEIGEFARATDALERYPAHEYNEQYWYYKAYIAYKRHRYGEAIVGAVRSREIDGTYMPALFLLIDASTVLQEYSAVARYAEEYKKLRPDSEYGYNVCAEAQLCMGNFSESSRNFYYAYKRLSGGDACGAMSAIIAARVGDGKRRSEILKTLRKKRSPYFSCVQAVLDYFKRRGKGTRLSKILYRSDIDVEFSVQLSVYLFKTGYAASAAEVAGVIARRGEPTLEVVAQQARLAIEEGNADAFAYYFEYYINKFAGADTPMSEKQKIADNLACGIGNRPETKRLFAAVGLAAN